MRFVILPVDCMIGSCNNLQEHSRTIGVPWVVVGVFQLTLAFVDKTYWRNLVDFVRFTVCLTVPCLSNGQTRDFT